MRKLESCSGQQFENVTNLYGKVKMSERTYLVDRHSDTSLSTRVAVDHCRPGTLDIDQITTCTDENGTEPGATL